MTTAARTPTLTFHDGQTIPQLGLGVWQLPDADTAELVAAAIDGGYRHIDTAMIYENERGVGEALRAVSVPREELYITTKLWNSDHGDALRACEASLERLGLDYLDLYLIHWPRPDQDLYVDAWRALIELRERGLVRSIGVSNFKEAHLTRIIDETGVTPVINQVELHPYFQQRELRAMHDRLDIRTEDWSPLGRGGDLLGEQVLIDIAAAHDATPAQVVIAWHLAIGSVVIPKTARVERLPENLAAARLTLAPDEIAAIDALDRPDGRIGPDPDLALF